MAGICKDCYDSVERVSDRQVVYTGPDIPLFSIKYGDSLGYVSQALIKYLSDTLNGIGIEISIDNDYYCTLVQNYLNSCEKVNALSLFEALVRAVCELNTSLATLTGRVNTIEAAYTIPQSVTVSAPQNTHNTLQGLLNAFHSLFTAFTTLQADLPTTYVQLTNLNALIQAYLNSNTNTKLKTKMVPNAIYPYYGDITNKFDSTGKGIHPDFEDIYLCNGLNQTPDLRGRSLIGVVQGVGGGPLASEVDPVVSPFAQNYQKGSTFGQTGIVLTTAQMPSHNHTITVGTHQHSITLALASVLNGTGSAVSVYSNSGTAQNINTSNVAPIATASSAGGSQAHNNVHPVLAVYFIMYKP
jgi:microcystin-dependent protein